MENAKPGKNYVNNTRLYNAFVEWYEQCQKAKEEGKSEPQPPSYISECIMLIPTRLASKGNFSGYSFKEEMVGDAIENLIRYYKNFDPTKSKNPFAYFTQIAYNSFLRRIHSEKCQSYIKHRLIKNSDILERISTQEHDDNIDYRLSTIEMLQMNLKPELETYFEGKKKSKRKIRPQKSIEDLLDKEST